MEKMNINILLIDDEINLLNALSMILSKFVTTVHAVENAIDALDFFNDNQNNIDLVITDLNMPQMNGLQLISKIRENCDKTIIYLSSGENDLDCTHEMNTYNIKRKLNKPTTIGKILENIKEDFK